MVTLKHKVTIKTKTAQEETPVAAKVTRPVTMTTQPQEASVTENNFQKPAITGHGSRQKKSKKGIILGGLVAAVAILVGVYSYNHFTPAKGSDLDDGTGEIVDAGQNPVSPKDQPTDISDEKNSSDATSNDPAISAEPENDVLGEPKSSQNSVSKENESEKSSDHVIAQTSTTTLQGTLEQQANRVIRGEFGNGLERKNKLGASYAEIQAKVNEMYRQGLVH